MNKVPEILEGKIYMASGNQDKSGNLKSSVSECSKVVSRIDILQSLRFKLIRIHELVFSCSNLLASEYVPLGYRERMDDVQTCIF